MKFEYLAQL